MPLFFFFTDTATAEIYTLSLHDALPICLFEPFGISGVTLRIVEGQADDVLNASDAVITASLDRKSTRLNSSHGYISYAVFCLKKKKQLHSSQLNGSIEFRYPTPFLFIIS